MVGFFDAIIHEFFMSGVLGLPVALYYVLIEQKYEPLQYTIVSFIFFIIFFVAMLKLMDYFDNPTYMVAHLPAKELWICLFADMTVFVITLFIPLTVGPFLKGMKVAGQSVNALVQGMLIVDVIRGTVWCLYGITKSFSD